jgi:putative NADH-flavin reductase
MKILVLGGTRGTGRCAVDRALAAGHDVTLIARDPSTFDGKHASLRVLKGDVLDPGTLAPAIAGQDAVLFAVGATLGALKQNPNIFSEGTKHTIEMMKPAGVKRLIVLSSHGSGDSRPYGGFLLNRIVRPLLLAPYFDDHERQEAIVKTTDLDWVIARPTLLTNGKATSKYKIVEQGMPGVRISRSDVADFMLSAIETDKYVRKALSLG